MEVKALMSTQVVSITPEESVALAARLMARHNLGALPVCDGAGRLQGILTDRDITVRCVAAGQDPQRQPVGELMSRQVTWAAPNERVHQAASRMAASQIRRLPVVDGGILVGMLSLGDLAKCRSCQMEAANTLEEISENCRQGNRG